MTLRARSAARVYQLGHRVGVGGMGEIYEGFAPELDRKVAVKRVLKSDDSTDLKDLFLREVAVAAALEHPNVVEVIDAGSAGGDLYLVMEFVDGPSLAEVVEALRRQGKLLPIELTCGLVAQIARGLAHAHERSLPDGTSLGILHRDVAPENVLITRTGLPKLADFGLATLDGHDFTNPGTIRGRPRCLSPEQARGERIDVRSDVFALGAMLFELSSGQSLYPNESLATLLFKVAAGQYESISRRMPQADPDLVQIIETACAQEPGDRFRSAREMERALDAFRAARGMRVDSGTISKLVANSAVEILRIRVEKREDGPGELEGHRLVLPPDRFEASQVSSRSGRFEADLAESSGDVPPEAFYDVPTRVGPKATDPVGRERSSLSAKLFEHDAEEEPETGPIDARAFRGRQSRDVPRDPDADPYGALPFVPRAPPMDPLVGDLPKPEAPALALELERERTLGDSEALWLVFLGVIAVAAAVAFGMVWSGHGPASGRIDTSGARGELTAPPPAGE